MSAETNIQYIVHEKIDLTKWDKCIANAQNGLIYGYSFYLDHMAKNWDALVLNDYEMVMPLTWNRKYGVYYLYQPFLTAELGIFGNNINAEILESFLLSIPGKFSYWDISLNHQNVFNLKKFRLYSRKNYVLDLNKPYRILSDNYSENIKRNIRKAQQSGCKSTKDFDGEKVIQLALAQMRNYSKESSANAERFRKLYSYLHREGKATTYGILSTTNELIASCIFLFSNNRAYYILVGNHPDSRTTGASHALIDSFIKDHAGKRMLLDFEGSDIPGLASFYSSFGASEEKFAAIKLNRLPFFLRWLKK